MVKKDLSYKLLSFMCLLICSACDIGDEYTDSPQKNFDALWKILDENYCFFDYKEVDWDEVYEEYLPYINEEYDLFYTLVEMINTLKDGHVNLFDGDRISRYDGWKEDDPFYFEYYRILDYYLKGNYSFFDDVVFYKAIENGTIGYIYYKDFSESVLEKELDLMFERLKNCTALIIDVRGNGGGSLTNSDRLAARFFHRKTLTGYIQHKTGKGHNDFSSPYPIYLEPSHSTLWPENKPVIVLTNRDCYSATNNFVSKMKVLQNVTTIGVPTGGGSGFPFSSELPNGWSVRFSTSPILNTEKQHTEFGIAPDILVTEEEKEKEGEHYTDPIIERALKFLTTGK